MKMIDIYLKVSVIDSTEPKRKNKLIGRMHFLLECSIEQFFDYICEKVHIRLSSLAIRIVKYFL